MPGKVTGIRHRVSSDGGAGPHAMVPGPQLIRVHDSIDPAGFVQG